MTFGEKYGPWAVIAGASEGTGRAFARQVAAQGINCVLVARDGPPTREAAANSHGLPLPGNSVKIVEPLTGALVAIGERGEIAIKGPTLMLGYLGVSLDRSTDSEGFFRTGDGGFLDQEGRLHWEGRLNDIVKTGGANVSPVEVDDILETCPGVKVTKTVGVPDELLGEMVVACIVPQDGATLSEEAVRAFARTKLASYKVPRRVLFFTGQELQLTGSAKVKTADLLDLAGKRLLADDGGAG